MSHSIKYNDSLKLKKYDFPVEGVNAYSCSGTPADCVRVGILEFMDKTPDVVFSGINFGYNISGDIQYSGTCGAALEASFWGIPAIAFSNGTGGCTEVCDKYLEKAEG